MTRDTAPEQSELERPTPSQTVGPYFTLGMKLGNVIAREDTEGERIRIEGNVFDGDGDPIFNVLIELWQANAHGRYNHPHDQRDVPLDPNFIGFGRTDTDPHGHYEFRTVKPGPVPFQGDEMQAPHVVLLIHASGVFYPLMTRMYFADDPRTESDPVLQLVPQGRRRTLLARPEERDGEKVYRFDIVLRGESEDLVLLGKKEGAIVEAAAEGMPSGAGKAETVFFAIKPETVSVALEE